jgi:hypothetical protein
MNPALIATFQGVASDLLTAFGAPATYQGDTGGTLAIQAIVETATATVGDYGELLEPRPVATLNRAEVGEPRRGDTLICNDATYLVDGILADRSDEYTVTVALRADE